MFRFAGRACVLMASAALMAASAFAQGGSSAPVSLIVPYPPGSAFDIVARQIQRDLGAKLGRTVVVENFGGASGSLAAQKLLNADANALTLLVGSPNELTLPPLALPGVHYRPQDFRMVSQLTTGALALMTRPDLPAANIQELIAQAARPGSGPLSFGSTGIGSIFHLVGVDFGRRAGLQLNHVPYRGGAPAMQDLMGGQIDLVFLPLIPSYIQSAQAGKIKVLAVLAGERNTAMPEVPSVDEIPKLRGFHYSMWTGLFLSAKAPEETAAAVGKAANDIVASREFRDWVAGRGNSAGAVMTLDQAAAWFDEESKRFEKLAREIDLQGESRRQP